MNIYKEMRRKRLLVNLSATINNIQFIEFFGFDWGNYILFCILFLLSCGLFFDASMPFLAHITANFCRWSCCWSQITEETISSFIFSQILSINSANV